MSNPLSSESPDADMNSMDKENGSTLNSVGSSESNLLEKEVRLQLFFFESAIGATQYFAFLSGCTCNFNISHLKWQDTFF